MQTAIPCNQTIINQIQTFYQLLNQIELNLTYLSLKQTEIWCNQLTNLMSLFERSTKTSRSIQCSLPITPPQLAPNLPITTKASQTDTLSIKNTSE